MIEYKVRPVTRWVVSRYERSDNGGSSCAVCEVSNEAGAESIAGSLAQQDGGTFECVTTKDLADIPLLMRRIADQLEHGELKADFGVLTLRTVRQRRPAVFRFGDIPADPLQELEMAAKEIRRLSQEYTSRQ